MKKILLGLSLIVIAMFLIGCVNTADLKEDESALAGQAIGKIAKCIPKSPTCSETGISCPKYLTMPKLRCKVGTTCTNGKCVVPSTCGNLTPADYCVGINTITKTKNTCTGKVTIAQTNTKQLCNPGFNSSVGGGGGVSLYLGQSCDNNNLIVSNTAKYNCSQEKGWLSSKTCAPFTGQEFEFASELLGYGAYTCKEACMPGETVATCGDNDFYELTCNDNGLDYKVSQSLTECPMASTCDATAGKCVIGTCTEYLVNLTCVGTEILKDVMNDSCTDPELKINLINCSTQIGIGAGKTKVCAIKETLLQDNALMNITSCYEPCVQGETAVRCTNGHYGKYICNPDGLNFVYNSSLTGCPTGTTCQNNQFCK